MGEGERAWQYHFATALTPYNPHSAYRLPALAAPHSTPSSPSTANLPPPLATRAALSSEGKVLPTLLPLPKHWHKRELSAKQLEARERRKAERMRKERAEQVKSSLHSVLSQRSWLRGAATAGRKERSWVVNAATRGAAAAAAAAAVAAGKTPVKGSPHGAPSSSSQRRTPQGKSPWAAVEGSPSRASSTAGKASDGSSSLWNRLISLLPGRLLAGHEAQTGSDLSSPKPARRKRRRIGMPDDEEEESASDVDEEEFRDASASDSGEDGALPPERNAAADESRLADDEAATAAAPKKRKRRPPPATGIAASRPSRRAKERTTPARPWWMVDTEQISRHVEVSSSSEESEHEQTRNRGRGRAGKNSRSTGSKVNRHLQVVSLDGNETEDPDGSQKVVDLESALGSISRKRKAREAAQAAITEAYRLNPAQEDDATPEAQAQQIKSPQVRSPRRKRVILSEDEESDFEQRPVQEPILRDPSPAPTPPPENTPREQVQPAAVRNKTSNADAAVKRVSFGAIEEHTIPSLPSAESADFDDDFDELLPDPVALVDAVPSEAGSSTIAALPQPLLPLPSEDHEVITRFAMQPDVLGRLVQIRQLASVTASGTIRNTSTRLNRSELIQRLAMIDDILNCNGAALPSESDMSVEPAGAMPAPTSEVEPSPSPVEEQAPAPDSLSEIPVKRKRGRPKKIQKQVAVPLVGRAPPKAVAAVVETHFSAAFPNPPAEPSMRSPSPPRPMVERASSLTYRASSPSPEQREAAEREKIQRELARLPPGAVEPVHQSTLSPSPRVRSPARRRSSFASPPKVLEGEGRAKRGAAVRAAQITAMQYADPWDGADVPIPTQEAPPRRPLLSSVSFPSQLRVETNSSPQARSKSISPHKLNRSLGSSPHSASTPLRPSTMSPVKRHAWSREDGPLQARGLGAALYTS